MMKFIKTGTVTHLAKHGASYGNFSPVSLQEALNIQIDAQKMFMELPAKVRKEFSNSPYEFLVFMQDEKNADKLIELGLGARRPKPETPPPAGTAGTPPEVIGGGD